MFGTLEQVAEEFDVLGDFVAELAVELVAADAAEVVALLGEEGALEVLAGRLDGLHLAGTRASVDLEPRGLLARAQEVLGRVLEVVLVHVLGDLEVRLLPVRVELVLEEVEVRDELLEEGLVHDGVEGAQQREH